MLKQIVLALLITVTGIQYSQAQDEPSPMAGLPRHEVVRMQIEALMNEDIVAFKMAYTKDVEIYKFPMIELAKGFDASISYWEARFDQSENIGHEMLSLYEVENTAVATIRKLTPSEKGEEPMVIIFEFEKEQIRRVHLIEK